MKVEKSSSQVSNQDLDRASLRYGLAKKKMNALFIKWLRTNKGQVEDLLKQAKLEKLNARSLSTPLFPPRPNSLSATLSNQSSNSIFQSTITPPRQSLDSSDQLRRSSLNEANMASTITVASLSRNSLGKSMSIQQQKLVDTQKIPQFFFPQGKPLDSFEQSALKVHLKDIQENLNLIFGSQEYIDQSKCKQLIQKVLLLPTYFTPLFLAKYGNDEKKLSKTAFLNYWKQFASKPIHKRAFCLLTNEQGQRYLTLDSFKQLLKVVMDQHPGLAFLQSSPQFQQFYSICVVNRMFFMANTKWDYKLTYREFKNSNILKSFFDIEAEPEINSNKDFFCYQDFYVIYIKFWQLDVNHRFLLTKQEFSKYSSYTLSRKAVERIFSQVAKKFQNPEGTMNFGDFVWFMLCAEDKTTKQSITYWFRILDLDNNGIVTGYELEYFFEEQNQRMGESQNGADFNYENTICQMIDLMKPSTSLQFTLDDFLKINKDIGIFINQLTDLNKMIAFDQRQPYEDRAFRSEHPDWNQWDRFVKPEYRKLEALDNNQDEEINLDNDE